MNTRHRVLIDCDPGIDDALALMLAAAAPEFELLGVTCVAGNRPLATTADNACRVLDVAEQHRVSVHAGCSRPLMRAEPRCNLVHGHDGLGGVTLPRRRSPSSWHAVDVLERMLMQEPPGRVTVVAVGPLTNLALAELKRPGMLKRAREILVMGGAAFVRGNVTPEAEFNFHADPLAAHVVLSAGARLKLFPLDVTSQAVMSSEWIDSLAALGNACGRAAHLMLRAYAEKDALLHDACPIAWLLDPNLFRSRRCTLSVDWHPGEHEGRLHAAPDERSGAAEVFTGVRCDGLLPLVRERLARLP